MEISKTGSIAHQRPASGDRAVHFRRSSLVSKTGPTALASGDSFKLFNAGSYLGSFTTVLLPLLTPGLSWSNTLS